MRRKRTHLTPIEARIVVSMYREGMPVKQIMAKTNCALTTILKFARLQGVQVPRPKPPRKTPVRKPKTIGGHHEAKQ